MLTSEQKQWAVDQIARAAGELREVAEVLTYYADPEIDGDALDTAADMSRIAGSINTFNSLR